MARAATRRWPRSGVSEGHQATRLPAAARRGPRPRRRGLQLLPAPGLRPAEREFLIAVAALCAQALDRARLYTAEHEARAAAERERDRMAFLAQASRLMEAPLSVEERLRQLGDLVVKGIADWSAVHLVRGTRVERVTVAHLDPAKIAFVEELERRYPPDPDAPGGAIEVARTGVPVVMPDVPDELLVASARDETHLELIRAIGLRSAIVVPLLVRGRSLGALTLVHAESGERFTDDGPDVRRPARRHRRGRPRQRRPLRAAAHGGPHPADGAAAQRAARRARRRAAPAATVRRARTSPTSTSAATSTTSTRTPNAGGGRSRSPTSAARARRRPPDRADPAHRARRGRSRVRAGGRPAAGQRGDAARPRRGPGPLRHDGPRRADGRPGRRDDHAGQRRASAGARPARRPGRVAWLDVPGTLVGVYPDPS